MKTLGLPEPQKYVKMMTLVAVIRGSGPLFYVLLGCKQPLTPSFFTFGAWVGLRFRDEDSRRKLTALRIRHLGIQI